MTLVALAAPSGVQAQSDYPDPETRARWAPIGIEPRPSAPQEFDRLVRDEIALFTKTARAADIRAE